jgi:hypothetical protein
MCQPSSTCTDPPLALFLDVICVLLLALGDAQRTEAAVHRLHSRELAHARARKYKRGYHSDSVNIGVYSSYIRHNCITVNIGVYSSLRTRTPLSVLSTQQHTRRLDGSGALPRGVGTSRGGT